MNGATRDAAKTKRAHEHHGKYLLLTASTGKVVLLLLVVHYSTAPDPSRILQRVMKDQKQRNTISMRSISYLNTLSTEHMKNLQKNLNAHFIVGN